MLLQPGTTLGSFEVIAKIGEGGMGEVYQARDTKLGRDVALKVLPEAFTSDPDRLARFEREARVLTSLNHPNIGTIYGLEQAEPSTHSTSSGLTGSGPFDSAQGRQAAVKALVLELVEGPTLADRIAQGPIPLDDALPIARQIADALEAAHEAGVIHRDLKPANVKVKVDGTVKVLDFGLAKAVAADPSAALPDSPTISLTAAATQLGMVIGTAAYMASEQAKGRPVDKRADVWAFGAVLYEMLSGRKPFVGDDVSDTLAAVLRAEVDLNALPDGTSETVRRVITACLQRDPKQRVHDVADLRLALDGAFETGSDAPSSPVEARPLPVWQRPAAVALIALTTATAAGVAVWLTVRPESVQADLMRFDVTPSAQAPFGSFRFSSDLAISRDGALVVYTGPDPANPGRPWLYARYVDQVEGAPLRGGDGGQSPFVAPDGEWVGFVSGAGGATLRKVSIRSGESITLAQTRLRVVGATWADGGHIVFGTQNGGLFEVSGDGGEPEALTTLDIDANDDAHVWPSVIPGRSAVVFVIRSESTERDADGRLAVLDRDTGDVQRLELTGTAPRYLSTGHLAYAAMDGALRAVPFDAESLEVTGSPVALVEGILVKPYGIAGVAVSENGRLVYATGDAGLGARPTRLAWVDRAGNTEMLERVPAEVFNGPRLSPNGGRVLVGADGDFRIYEIASGRESRVTTDGLALTYGEWTPSGAEVVYSGGGDGTTVLFIRSADGSGPARELRRAADGAHVDAVSPDGQRLAFHVHASGDTDQLVLTLDGTDATNGFLEGELRHQHLTFSPDGRYAAYDSNQTGQGEVYIRPFPGPGAQQPVSVGGGQGPLWGRNGELFYRRAVDGMLMAVNVATEPTLEVGLPTELFPVAAPGGSSRRRFDVTADGQRFLMPANLVPSGATSADVEAPEPDPLRLTLVVNWDQELLARVPVP